MHIRAFSKYLTLLIALFLCACAEKATKKYPTGYDRTETRGDIYAPRETIWKHGSPIDKFLNKPKVKEGTNKPKVNE